MSSSARSKTSGFVIIAVGALFSFVSAVVPFYSHHKLMVGVLAVGLLPYLVYGFVVVFLKGALNIATGLVLLVIHGATVIGERFIGDGSYNGGPIYYVPVILTVAILPLVVLASRKPWHK